MWRIINPTKNYRPKNLNEKGFDGGKGPKAKLAAGKSKNAGLRSLNLPALLTAFAPFLLMFLILGIFLSQPSYADNESVKTSGPAAPFDLRVEYLTNPLGVDVQKPRFFWKNSHPERGQKQTAFELIVSTSPDASKADMWNSGKVNTDSSIQIVYGGKPLESNRTYYWKVRIFDAQGKVSPWSEVARFDTGLFAASDWKGEWIGGENLLRREFNLPAEPRRARAFISGLGYYELRINGHKIGDHVLDPGWTTFSKRALYVTHDVTSALHKGKNAIGVILGNGWYKSKALMFQLYIECEDGTLMEIHSDTSWKTARGPIIEDSIYNGETYDARLEQPGWDLPDFNDKSWKPAQKVKAPGGVLSAQLMPAIKVVDTIVPLVMTNPAPGVYVFDLGQNISGWAQLRVRGPRGTDVRLRFAELLYDNGMINQENLRSARAEDHYILKGDGEEIWEPRFTYHGFRYIEVTGFPGTPKIDSVRGRVVHTAVSPVGNFFCSKQIINDIQRIILWGQKTNLHSIPTDCNQRDERMGWMGDAQVTAEEAMMNYDMAAFYTNFLRNIRDVQGEDGSITDTVPHIWGSRPADPAWGTAYPLIAWYMYRYYGDKRILEEHYDSLKKYVEFLRSRAENGLVKYSYYGDWVAIDKCPGSLVSSFYYYYDVKILADVARVLGKHQEADAYLKLAAEIKEAFNREFLDPNTKNYAGGSQTANTLPLFIGLAPDNARGGVWGNLFNDIVYKHDSHLTTGIIGTKYILDVLTAAGNSDLAYDLLTKTDFPSYGYMIKNGATTLWELWQKREGPSMNSHNHPMFGSIGAWFYRALAGINMATETLAYKKLIIKPQMVRDLTHASGSIYTINGEVSCSWEKADRRVRLEVVIPVGSEAEIYIPVFKLRNLKLYEGSTLVWADNQLKAKLPGIEDVQLKSGNVVIKAGSGKYIFELTGD
ncbi:MAG: family 78 glycoside hydrolase catalytic domain [Candidatus Aminicenantes bacterium]|nr:family 78 glycoside hydrolase catalytic domain [Candidatus Aminicenantes bacterium]